MATRQSKTILTIILVLAAILGLVAVGLAYYYSQIKDNDTTGQQGSGVDTKCNAIYVKDSDGKEIPTSQELDPTKKITIGARFQYKKDAGEPFKSFKIVVNSDQAEETIELADARKEEVGEFVYYFPEIEFSDYESVNTLQIQTIAEASTTLPSGADLDCIAIYTVATSSTDGSDGGTDGGTTDGNEPDSCLTLGQEGSLDADDFCCDAYTAVECSAPDSNNQCVESNPDCFKCVLLDDNNCGVGENVCNSPQECGDGQTDGGEPITCIRQGETGSSGKGEQCCSGLTQGTCALPDSANQCPQDNTGCFVCNVVNDNQCSPGENICNSPTDCKTEPTTPPTNNGGGTVTNPSNTSNFIVTKNGTTCVERIAPNNIAQFTITIQNSDTQYEDILQIKDKLPLGFQYYPNSTTINGQAQNDSTLTVSQVGSTQELVWADPDGWILASGEVLTLKFSATAGDGALTGDNLNEVIITPVNTPVNSTALRASYTINVAQSCSTPNTGLLDSIQAKIVAGVLIIALSFAFYTTTLGERVSLSAINNPTVTVLSDLARMTGLKLTQPRKYFEEKVSRTIRQRK